MKVIFFRWTKASAIQIIASVKHELQPEYYMTFDNNNKLSEHHSMSYFILRNERWAFFRFDLTLFDICAQFMPNSMKLNQLFVVPVDHFNQIWITTWLNLTLSHNKICLPACECSWKRKKKKKTRATNLHHWILFECLSNCGKMAFWWRVCRKEHYEDGIASGLAN